MMVKLYSRHIPQKFLIVLVSIFILIAYTDSTVNAQITKLARKADTLAAQVEEKVIAWRRDFHEHPELSNREYKTAEKVAKHLQSLGIETRTGVANTGVVGLLKGGKPGPVVAVRADMDALPITEATGLPFASKVRTEDNGAEVGVMHACGHDCHTAMLMGVAEVLAGIRKDLPGSVKFIFQPAEEVFLGGAADMIEEGAFENPRPDVVFGQHVTNDYEVGTIGYKPGGAMASINTLNITVKGRQTHGAYPWDGIDPIVTASQIVLGLQTIVSRGIDLTVAPAVVTIGIIEGGVRPNIIPDEVKMTGTIRILDPGMKTVIHDRIRRIVSGIAESAGATAEVSITGNLPVLWNDPGLADKMRPTLERIHGGDNVIIDKIHTGGEDFAYYAQEVPGLFVFLGALPKGTKPEDATPAHSPYFSVDEGALVYGVRTMTALVVDYMMQNK